MAKKSCILGRYGLYEVFDLAAKDGSGVLRDPVLWQLDFQRRSDDQALASKAQNIINAAKAVLEITRDAAGQYVGTVYFFKNAEIARAFAESGQPLKNVDDQLARQQEIHFGGKDSARRAIAGKQKLSAAAPAPAMAA